jgi:hypothetical protein
MDNQTNIEVGFIEFDKYHDRYQYRDVESFKRYTRRFYHSKLVKQSDLFTSPNTGDLAHSPRPSSVAVGGEKSFFATPAEYWGV